MAGKPLNANERELVRAVGNEDVDAVRRLIEEDGVNVNIQDSLQRTPIIRACFGSDRSSREEIGKILLDNGADVNLADRHGRTALMTACMEDEKEDMVDLILSANKVDANRMDENGNTALMHAVMIENVEAVRVFFTPENKNKVNTDMKNFEDKTPLLVAAKQQNTEICEILVREGNARHDSIPSFFKQHLPEECHDEDTKKPQDKWEDLFKGYRDNSMEPNIMQRSSGKWKEKSKKKPKGPKKKVEKPPEEEAEEKPDDEKVDESPGKNVNDEIKDSVEKKEEALNHSDASESQPKKETSMDNQLFLKIDPERKERSNSRRGSGGEEIAQEAKKEQKAIASTVVARTATSAKTSRREATDSPSRKKNEVVDVKSSEKIESSSKVEKKSIEKNESAKISNKEHSQSKTKEDITKNTTAIKQEEVQNRSEIKENEVYEVSTTENVNSQTDAKEQGKNIATVIKAEKKFKKKKEKKSDVEDISNKKTEEKKANVEVISTTENVVTESRNEEQKKNIATVIKADKKFKKGKKMKEETTDSNTTTSTVKGESQTKTSPKKVVEKTEKYEQREEIGPAILTSTVTQVHQEQASVTNQRVIHTEERKLITEQRKELVPEPEEASAERKRSSKKEEHDTMKAVETIKQQKTEKVVKEEVHKEVIEKESVPARVQETKVLKDSPRHKDSTHTIASSERVLESRQSKKVHDTTKSTVSLQSNSSSTKKKTSPTSSIVDVSRPPTVKSTRSTQSFSSRATSEGDNVSIATTESSVRRGVWIRPPPDMIKLQEEADEASLKSGKKKKKKVKIKKEDRPVYETKSGRIIRPNVCGDPQYTNIQAARLKVVAEEEPKYHKEADGGRLAGPSYEDVPRKTKRKPNSKSGTPNKS
ncbi:inversin-like [Lytechinus variegatus]|uniref:inversin-like n=1 Tax=Lytechinus variegatus TaxID=7654 RepID=UPI001BB1B187|nr:inversin-like [Lytechinus variegatus]